MTAVFFVKERKDFLVQEAKGTLEHLLSRESDFEVHIGSLSGSFLGRIRFKDVKVLNPGPFPEQDRLLFRASEISFRTRFLDLVSKKLASRIEVAVRDPEVFWRPRVHLSSHRDLPFFGWMRQWALAQKELIDIRVENMSLFFESQNFKLEGVNLSYENDQLKAEIPLRHLTLGSMDISTVINARGNFRLGLFGGEDSIAGEFYTEGTVVNWSPLPEESKFHFIFLRTGFELTSADIFGGIGLEGRILFDEDYRMECRIRAKDYPLSNLNFILKASPKSMLPSRMDVDLHFEGSPLAPAVEGIARIHEGYIGSKTFKALDLQISGVYPTVRLENSRLLLEDDSVMKFADKTLEFREFFSNKTYETLIGEAQQDTVVWGDWEFRRPRDIKDNPEFLLQRTLGDRARLNFRDYKRDEMMRTEDSDKVEVGLEYRLAEKNSLKLQLREDEQFVGVERKVKF